MTRTVAYDIGAIGRAVVLTALSALAGEPPPELDTALRLRVVRGGTT